MPQALPSFYPEIFLRARAQFYCQQFLSSHLPSSFRGGFFSVHVVYVPRIPAPSAPAGFTSGTSIVVQLAVGDGLSLEVETLTSLGLKPELQDEKKKKMKLIVFQGHSVLSGFHAGVQNNACSVAGNLQMLAGWTGLQLSAGEYLSPFQRLPC